jgi:hypothetical protein
MPLARQRRGSFTTVQVARLQIGSRPSPLSRLAAGPCQIFKWVGYRFIVLFEAAFKACREMKLAACAFLTFQSDPASEIGNQPGRYRESQPGSSIFPRH